MPFIHILCLSLCKKKQKLLKDSKKLLWPIPIAVKIPLRNESKFFVHFFPCLKPYCSFFQKLVKFSFILVLLLIYDQKCCPPALKLYFGSRTSVVALFLTSLYCFSLWLLHLFFKLSLLVKANFAFCVIHLG